MRKTAENIGYPDPKNDKCYLQDLLLNIKQAYANQDDLTFKIVDPKEKGFTVKVGGLFAYVYYRHFGWSYPSMEFWKNVSKYLVGNFFRGKIHKVKESPILIQIDAKGQIFKKPNLQKYKVYKGVIAQKTKYGAFVDLGLHFNWKFGSLLGLIHKSALIDQIDYETWKAGEEIVTLFQGFNENGQLVLGNNRERGKWLNGEMDKFIGTIQKTTVRINENGQTEFYVLGEHKGKAPMLKEFYPDFRTAAKKYACGLKNDETIDCEIVRINKRKDNFVLKLLVDPPQD